MILIDLKFIKKKLKFLSDNVLNPRKIYNIYVF